MRPRRMLLAAMLCLHASALAQEAVVNVTAPRLYAGDKISVDFQNVGVRAALHILADASGQNIIASDSVAGNVTVRLRDLPWDQALDVLLQAKGLDMRRNGSVLWIAPREEILAREKLELEQRAQIAELEPLQSAIFQLNYQKAEAFRTVFGLDAGEGRSRLLSRRGSVLIEPRTNQLFITDVPARLEQIRQLIARTDIPTRQVMIEARIVEANDSFSRNLGARLGFTDQRLAAGQQPGFSLGGSGRRAAVGGSYQGVGEATGQTVAGSGAFVPNTQFVNLPAASTYSRHQNAAPFGTNIGFSHSGSSIVKNCVFVQGSRELIQSTHYKSRNISKCFFTIIVVKSMQHAVIRIDKYDRAAILVSLEKRVVANPRDSR